VVELENNKTNQIHHRTENNLLITPVASNEVLTRFPRPLTELFLRCRFGVVLGVSGVRPLAIAAIALDLSCLFLWILGVSCSGSGILISTALDFPFRLTPGVSGRDENGTFAWDDKSVGSITVRALDSRRSLSASSSIARTSFSTSKSEATVSVARWRVRV
jgi:hypothetical protein